MCDLLCVRCLRVGVTPDLFEREDIPRAVTIIDGDAVCLDHLRAGRPFIAPRPPDE